MAFITLHLIQKRDGGAWKMREKTIEEALVKAVKNAGGRCLKFTCPGFAGVPDRLMLLPGGKIAFIELKAPGKKPRALQIKRMKQLSALGFMCFVIDNKDGIGGVIDAVSAS